jgi:hypothetical protein
MGRLYFWLFATLVATTGLVVFATIAFPAGLKWDDWLFGATSFCFLPLCITEVIASIKLLKVESDESKQ